jgi:hypothetical protein
MSVSHTRKAIRSLRVGIVPSSYVIELTVGIEAIRPKIDQHIAEAKKGRQRSVVIRGEWGTGKSNLLAFLREYSLRQEMAFAYINLNGNAAALNYPQRFYHRIITSLRLPGTTNGSLQELLSAAADSEWVTENRHRSEFAWALYQFVQGHEEAALRIIRGTDIYWSDYAYRKQKAINRINDLGAYLRSIGFKGLLLEFDELETIEQLWNRASRKGAYRILRQILNLNNVWSVFAATEKVNKILEWDKYMISDIEALTFIDQFLSLPALRTPGLDHARALDLVGRLETLYRSAYPVLPSIAGAEIVDRWERMAISNHRRLIRYAVDCFDRYRALP